MLYQTSFKNLSMLSISADQKIDELKKTVVNEHTDIFVEVILIM